MTKAKGVLLLAAPAMVLAGLTGLPGAAYAQADGGLPAIESHTAGFERFDGFFPLYWDDDAGTLWLEIGHLGDEVLYVNALAAGVGSNDIGLDRGQLGGSRIVRFERVGRKVLMVQPNYRYRATTSNPAERRAVEDAFATSVLFGFAVAARTDDRFLVDATPFLLRDVHGVADRLPGAYRLDGQRSAVHLPRTKAFPENTEMEATLTFARERQGDGPGFGRGSIEAVAPSADAVTVRQHQSLVALPDDGYTPRPYDPRAGYGAVSYVDYATPLGQPMTRRYLRRHRLEKRDPSAEVSEAIEPIVYHLDRGTPEPVRSALLDGARWWNQAFEAAGYRDAFRVELMPEGADPLDVRYNVIQWVHRSTRGWSYGSSVTDPRTGEIIKGHVTLGSLRVRQDYLIAEGLLSPYLTGDEEPPELAELALARIRQLSAHEVGHTLGLGHNYYASRQGRISVMDYPHPLVTLGPDAQIDLSDAYDVGIGEWDQVAIAYGYQDYPAGTDATPALESLLDEAWEEDVRYLTNQDAAAHPRVHQWANGTDPARELERMLRVRRVALDRFGESAIPAGRPLATLEEALVPLYLHHRYQIDAAASALGGVDYVYAMRGDGRVPGDPSARGPAARGAGGVAAHARAGGADAAPERAATDTAPAAGAWAAPGAVPAPDRAGVRRADSGHRRGGSDGVADPDSHARRAPGRAGDSRRDAPRSGRGDRHADRRRVRCRRRHDVRVRGSAGRATGRRRKADGARRSGPDGRGACARAERTRSRRGTRPAGAAGGSGIWPGPGGRYRAVSRQARPCGTDPGGSGARRAAGQPDRRSAVPLAGVASGALRMGAAARILTVERSFPFDILEPSPLPNPPPGRAGAP